MNIIDSIEEYCKERWDFTPMRASQLIASAKTALAGEGNRPAIPSPPLVRAGVGGGEIQMLVSFCPNLPREKPIPAEKETGGVAHGSSALTGAPFQFLIFIIFYIFLGIL